MTDLTKKIDELANLMDEFKLVEGEMSGENWRVNFSRRAPSLHSQVQSVPVPVAESGDVGVWDDSHAESDVAVEPEAIGEPVPSPMNGIYYSQPSPNAPAFVTEGQSVQEGDIVALIEAMKVFNEITAPQAGTVQKLPLKSGDLVAVDQPLLFIKPD